MGEKRKKEVTLRNVWGELSFSTEERNAIETMRKSISSCLMEPSFKVANVFSPTLSQQTFSPRGGRGVEMSLQAGLIRHVFHFKHAHIIPPTNFHFFPSYQGKVSFFFFFFCQSSILDFSIILHEFNFILIRIRMCFLAF